MSSFFQSQPFATQLAAAAPSSRSFFNGLAPILVLSATNTGDIQLPVSAAGCQLATAAVQAQPRVTGLFAP